MKWHRGLDEVFPICKLSPGLITEKKRISSFYIPTSESEYYASLMRIFYKNKLFLEIAVNKFLKSVNHQT